MSQADSGGLSVGQRIERLEENLDAHEQHTEIGFTSLWKKVSAMEIEAAKNQIKVAVLVGLCSAIGSAILSVGLSVLVTKVFK